MHLFEDTSPPFLGDAHIASLAGAWPGSTIMRAQTQGSGLRLAIPHRPPPKGGHLSLDMLIESAATQTFLLRFNDSNKHGFELTFTLSPWIQTRLRFDFDHLDLDTEAPSPDDIPAEWTYAGVSVKPNDIQQITLTLTESLDAPLRWHQDMLKLYRDRPPTLADPVSFQPRAADAPA